MNETKESNSANDKKLSEMSEDEIHKFEKEAKKIIIRPRNARANAM